MTPLALAALIAVPTLAVLAVLGRWLARRRVRRVQHHVPFETWTKDALDVIAQPDHRRAEHMNRTLRRAEGGDEHG